MSLSARSPSWYRRTFKDVSGQLVLGTSGDDQALVAALTNGTIFIQKIYVLITTQSNTFLSFESGSGSGTAIFITATNPAVGTIYEIDFGARGVALTEGEAFHLDVGATGLAATITWEGYAKLTGVGAPATTGGL